jgi:hypothetical protein
VNYGPDLAKNVAITDTFPNGLTFNTADLEFSTNNNVWTHITPGTVTWVGKTLTLNIGNLPIYTTPYWIDFRLPATVTSTGHITNTATQTQDPTTPNPDGTTTHTTSASLDVPPVPVHIPLVVISTIPKNNAFNVPLNKKILLLFNQDIEFGANPWIELKLTSSPGTDISFTPTISGSTLLITPNSLLKAGTQYTVILHTNSITTMGGIGLASPYVTRFITSTAPVITSTSPVNKAINVALNTVVKYNFNKAIKFGTNPWIEFKNSSGTTKPFTPSITGSTLNITPTTPLFIGTQYTVVIHSNSVTSLNGAGLAAPYTIKFTTTT